MHQEEAWYSKDDYHKSHISSVKIVPAAASLSFDSHFLKHNGMFDGSHAMNDVWLGQNMHQNQISGWSGFGTSSTSYYNHAASGSGSGSGSGGKKYLPAVTFLNASQFSNGETFNNTSMENGGGSYQTIQEVKYVPAATKRVQEVIYERSSANWGGDDDDGLQHCVIGAGMLSGFQRIEPKRRDFCHQIRRAWC